MRIGILGHSFIDWGGGIDFLRMVVSGLHHSGVDVELHALVPTRGPRLSALRALRHAYRSAKALVGRGKAVAPRADARHVLDLAESAQQPIRMHEIDIGATALARASRSLSLDVLIPAFAPLPRGFPVPWVGYLYDFQHRYLSQLFTPAECAQRDRQFAAMLQNAHAVIVNARSVAADIERFHPQGRARVFALPFGAAPHPAWLLPSASPAAKYRIQNPYFIICNQFWKHKDHATAFEAFARFAANHDGVDLVCTGPTDDYRDAAYFAGLQRMLERDGLAQRVHILGLVPKGDQIALLKGSIALIQPTLFEGGPGGGAVYDALALGVCCLVSDIAVNRELAEPGVRFFPAGDAMALAASMVDGIVQACTLSRDPQALRERGRARRAACGRQILAAIDHVLTPR